MSESDNQVDEYGFPKSSEYNRKIVYDHIGDTTSKTNNSGSSSKTWGSILITILFLLFLFMYGSAVCVAGFHAYNEYGSLPFWLKIVRIYLAIVFAPFYLFYIFVKSVLHNK